MADNYKDKERKKEDVFIKEKRRAKNFFVTSSAKMNEKEGISKTTISSSVFTDFSASFSAGDFLLDSFLREQNGSLIYMLQEMQHDIDDLYNEASASAFQSSYFPTARIDSGSFADISSSGNVSMMSAVIGGGIFTSASLAGGGAQGPKGDTGATGAKGDTGATGAAGADGTDGSDGADGTTPTVETKLINGSTNVVTNNAVFDGLATKLNLSGGTMTGNIAMSNAVIRPVMVTATSITNFTIDMRAANIFQIKAGSAWILRIATASHIGQEITIIGLSAGTIVNGKGKANTFVFANGSNLSVSAGQAYKFIVDANGVWRQIH